jgi:hypothetical protein
MWTLAYGYHEDRTLTHGYEATRQTPQRDKAIKTIRRYAVKSAN